jgi:Ca-activated chloride channel homolog
MADAFAAFHFLRPALLWALLPFGLHALALVLRGRAASPWAGVIAPSLLRHLVEAPALKRLASPEVGLIPLGVLAVLGAAGPTWAPQVDGSDPAQSPLAIVVELSHGMGGKDVSPSRAGRGRLELVDLVHARPSSPTALLVVAGTAHVLVPLTDDASVFEPFLQALAPDLMPSDGEDFAAVAPLLDTIAGAASAPLSVLLVTDGLPPSGAAALARLHRERGVGFVVLAVGSPDGDPAHGAAPLDLGGLERFADRVDGELIELSFAERDVQRILRAIALHRARGLAPRQSELWEDAGYLFAIPLLVGLAAWFRRGWMLGRLVLPSLLVLLSGCSSALDVWLTPDQQGQLLFDAGHYGAAAARFRDPMRRGLALYAGSHFDEAATAFAEVDTREGQFALGNAYAQGGKLGSALSAYERALRKSPTFRAARHNADLVRELIRSLQEDSDADDEKHPDRGSDDDATEVSADQLLKKASPAAAGAAAAPSASELSPGEEAAWLRQVNTEPRDFIKRKLAMQAARGTP